MVLPTAVSWDGWRLVLSDDTRRRAWQMKRTAALMLSLERKGAHDPAHALRGAYELAAQLNRTAALDADGLTVDQWRALLALERGELDAAHAALEGQA